MLLRGLVSLVALIVVMGALIFGAAGTFDYWQAWLFLACYFAASLVVSLWLITVELTSPKMPAIINSGAMPLA